VALRLEQVVPGLILAFMAIGSELSAFDRGVRPLAEMVLPGKVEVVLGFRPAPEIQTRIEELAAKSTEGRLTDAEREEYEGYVRANKFIAILQRLAREVSGQPR
jgi:hypothetical protein